MIGFCKISTNIAALVLGMALSVQFASAQDVTQGEHHAAPVVTPRGPDGRPDLSGLWMNTTRANGIELTLFPAPSAAPTTVDAQGNIARNSLARSASPVNSERDATLRRRADPNRPIYKAEFWQKVHELDHEGNAADSGFSCMPLGVPRMGPPNKIVQTPNEMIFLYESKNIFRLIPTDGRPHDPVKSGDPTLMGDSVAHWEGIPLSSA